MLSFATEFPVSKGQSSEEFIGAVKKWLLGSRHTRIVELDLEGIGSLGKWSIEKGKESLTSLNVKRDGVDATSVRYRSINNEIEWTTTLTFSNESQSPWVAIRVDRESLTAKSRIPPAKKPVIVRILLEDLGGGLDGDLQVDLQAHFLVPSQVEIAAKLIIGTVNCQLPVIYVSSNFSGEYTVNIPILSKEMAGLAHVVVEPNRQFSRDLKQLADSQNVYGGAIGIYWPNGAGRRALFIGDLYKNKDDLTLAIIEEVRSAVTNRRTMERCTWAYTQDMMSRQAIEELQASGSKEIDEYIVEFDAINKSQAERINEKEQEIRKLELKVRSFEARLASNSGIVFKAGSEQDLYPKEINDIIIDALCKYIFQLPADSRRLHVVNDFLRENIPHGEAKIRQEGLKNILQGYTKLDQKTRRGLEEMGFEISDNGKHYKLTFMGDDRYQFTIPKSGSDHRGGNNAASDIGRLLF